MNGPQQNNIKEVLMRRLPPVLSSIVAQFPLDRTLLDIGREQGLTIEHIGFLADAAAEFIAGTIDADRLLERLTMLAGGDKKRAARLAREVNRKVFEVIRNELKRKTDKRAVVREEPPAPEPPSRPAITSTPPPPPSARPSPPAVPPPAPKRPEPLIIHPLPSRPRGIADSGQGAGDSMQRTTSQPIARSLGATKSISPVMPSTPTPQPRPPSPAPEQRPLTPPPPPVAEGRVAPVIRPPGTPPARETPAPPTPEAPKPTPPHPMASYERAKEAVKRELSSFRPSSPQETAKAPEVKPAPPPTLDKEALQKEIERFRSPSIMSPLPSPAAPPVSTEAVKGAEPAPPAPRPLKLPQEKIPKPQAPEQYAVDPYKEPPE